MDAYELVIRGHCNGTCLVAAEGGGCNCRCGGKFHGALANVDVGPQPEPWWQAAGYSDLAFAEIPTVNQAWRLGTLAGVGRGGVWKARRSWCMKFELHRHRPRWDETFRFTPRQESAISELVSVFIGRHAGATAFVDDNGVWCLGIRTELEAKALLFVCVEVALDNFDGWYGAIRHLDGMALPIAEEGDLVEFPDEVDPSRWREDFVSI